MSVRRDRDTTEHQLRSERRPAHPFDAVCLRSSIAPPHPVQDPITRVQLIGAPDDGHVLAQVRASRVRGDEADPPLRVEARDHSLAAARRDLGCLPVPRPSAGRRRRGCAPQCRAAREAHVASLRPFSLATMSYVARSPSCGSRMSKVNELERMNDALRHQRINCEPKSNHNPPDTVGTRTQCRHLLWTSQGSESGHAGRFTPPSSRCAKLWRAAPKITSLIDMPVRALLHRGGK